MTIEEAVGVLSLAQNHIGVEYINGVENPFMTARLQRAIDTAITALRAQRESEKNPGEVSDGYHTFNELYHHRAVLFSVICNGHPELAWKSKKHHDPAEPMYDGMFIVGIETPNGQATYHYDLDPYWDMFRVKELESAPKWDGHTPAQAIERIAKMVEAENKPLTLEELCGMDGQPVFIRPPDSDFGDWALIDLEYELCRTSKNCPAVFETYGKTWLAYRRPPVMEG